MGRWRRSHAVSVSAIVLSMMSILCFDVCPTSAAWQGHLSAYELASFNNPDQEDVPRAQTFNHFTLSDHGDVYVGAVNWLYRLNSRLEQIQNASTCDDSMPYNGMPCRRTNNYNKILVVDSTRPNSLITCGGVFDGTCQLRPLQHINDVMGESRPYVAGFEDATTVSLIAPGRSGEETLYVAVTYTGMNVGNIFSWTITRRQLGRGRFLSYSANEDTVALRSFGGRFIINYIKGFDYSGFTYLVATQEEDLNFATYISKLSRVCQTGPNLDGFTEITIQCSGSDGSVYSLVQAAHFGPAGPDLAASLGLHVDEKVLYTVFAKNQGAPDTSGVPTSHSALCVYRMTDILAGFKEAVRGCIQDGDAYSVDYLEGSFCNYFQGVQPDNYLCNPVADGMTQLYQYAKGITPVSSTALLEQPGSLMSSIITSIEFNHTVAFIGTSSGGLLKVHIESNTTARLYERVPLGTSPVLTDVKINDTTREIYVLTEQKLIKMRAENCGQYTTCEACIGTDAGNDGDPYCGWCTLERKCSRYSDCDSPDVSTRWLAYNAAQCINITNVAPYDSLPITVTEQRIDLNVQQLPDLATGQSYECYFGSYRSPATKTGGVLTCRSSPSDGIPAIQPRDDAVIVNFSVYSTETMVHFIDTSFHFYNCSVHTSCVSCVGSRWACDWCVFDNRCTHESSTCTKANEIIITGENGPGSCPQLQAQSGEVLLPNGIHRIITVRTENVPDVAQISSYGCSLDIEGVPQTVMAGRYGRDIKCEQKAYTYLSNTEPELEVRLTVTWTDATGAAHILDDIHGFSVTIYKCEVQKSDCSRCVTARPELGCLWCGAMPTVSGVCKLNETCSGNVVTLFNGVNCPDPVVSEVFPLTGPIEGNTILTVMGTDIGRRFGDVVAVMVGNQPCDLDGLSSNYVNGASVICKTIPEREGSQLVTLTITGADGTLQHSSGVVNFKFTNPRITLFEPRLGPEAGGTAVSVYGTDLNTGRYIAAFIGEKPCIMSSGPTEEALGCTTSTGQAGMASILRVSFDGANRTSDEKFSYTENPVITRVQPLKSIYSGGRTLKVVGQHLDTCRNRQIYVGDSSLIYQEVCTGDSPTEMQCKSPNITSLRMMMASNENLTFGFIMDGVIELLAWSENNEVELEYFEDPVYVPFENEEMEKGGSTLTIMGERLDSAITAREIQVRIGKDFCEVNLVSDTVLQCTLPKNEPAAGDFRGENAEEGLPVVWILHSNLEFVLGRLIYPRTVHVPAIVAGVVLSFSIATLLVAVLGYVRQLHRKRTHDQRLLNRIMEVHLEMSSHVKRRWWQRVQKQMDEGPKQMRIVLSNKVSYVPEELHIELNRLELGKTLGQGAFGRVLQAVLHSEAGDQIVAVKTVQG
ncbi:plexin-B-like isoform X2 [Acanthaster planci]|uniref:Plexin-B-like isoform X2 n=1 Tax=Acanthaster planci TaxID=133434 RepID=A0A8B7ZHA4_ACAPL|nr:plexin-B-like isoform X2 [Acanthaster planci]